MNNDAKDYLMDLLDPYKEYIQIINEKCESIDNHIDEYCADIQFTNKHEDMQLIHYNVQYYIYSGSIGVSIVSDDEMLQFAIFSESSYYINKVINSLHLSIYESE